MGSLEGAFVHCRAATGTVATSRAGHRLLPASPARFPSSTHAASGLPASECMQHGHMSQTKRSPESPSRFRSWAGSQLGRVPVPEVGPYRASSDRWRGLHPWCAVQPRDPTCRLACNGVRADEDDRVAVRPKGVERIEKNPSSHDVQLIHATLLHSRASTQ